MFYVARGVLGDPSRQKVITTRDFFKVKKWIDEEYSPAQDYGAPERGVDYVFWEDPQTKQTYPVYSHEGQFDALTDETQDLAMKDMGWEGEFKGYEL